MPALKALNKKLLALPAVLLLSLPGYAQVSGTHISDDQFLLNNSPVNQSVTQVVSQTVKQTETKSEDITVTAPTTAKRTEVSRTVTHNTQPAEKASVVTDAQLPSAADLTLSESLAYETTDSNDRDDADVSTFSNLYLSLAVLMLMGAAVLAVYILMNRQQLWYGSRY